MNHLLAISVGPVQEFIAAARRTRDLWFGSYLLSEISKATAKAVQDNGGTLIFPASVVPEEDLLPDSPLNVSNIILAEVNGHDPQEIFKNAKKAAERRWRDFADPVFHENQQVIRSDIWLDQVDDVIECYAAWVSVTGNYPVDRKRLMRLLAGRKNCRNFKPANGRAGVPKSSLDGLRESVLVQPERGESLNEFRTRWPISILRRLRISDGEQLDVIGVVKRAWERAGERLSYPSVSRVAADSWIRGVGAISLAELISECQTLGRDVLRPLNIKEDGHPKFALFPYEGTAVFRSRYRELTEEAGVDIHELQPLSNALRKLVAQFGEPSPYLAMIVADGDSMGKALSKLESPDKHRQFSQSLAGFAAGAKKVVQDHYGILVYAGGDDVLGFVPVDKALSCARKLHDDFGTTMEKWAAKTGTELTLSVGVAIAHFMEPLEDLLNYGRAAEKHAKDPKQGDKGQSPRNGLAVHLLKRGGGPIAVRTNWKNQGLDHHLAQLAEWINSKSISGRVAYDLRQIAELYNKWPENLVGSAIRSDTLSILKGKQPSGDDSRMEDVKQFVRESVVDSTSLRRLSEELLIARQMSVALRQSSGTGREEAVSR